MDYRDFVEGVLKNTSQLARKSFGKVTTKVKPEDNNQVLTEADNAIGSAIIENIRQTFPTHSIIDEEAGIIDNHSEYVWVIDPIDGTSNFANSIPLYGIYLGLLYQDVPLVGGISIPSFDEIYVGQKGKGALCNSRPIQVSHESLLKNSLVAYGIDAHPEEENFITSEGNLLIRIVLGVRNIRTSNSAYDGALVAKGAYGAWLCRSSKIWDNVALQVIIEEAGGVYTDFYGNPVDYAHSLEKTQQNFTYCAGAPQLHYALQKIIHNN